MRGVRAVCETVHLTALGLWAGSLLAVGAFAAVTFPTMKRLDPSLPQFAGYPDPHWPIAAGSVANRVFVMGDWLGVAAAAIAIATLGLVLWTGGDRMTRVPTVLRSIALLVVAAITALTMLTLRPEMDHELQAYWDAARAGDVEVARKHKAAFDAMHPRASMLLVTQLIFVLWALGAGLFGAITNRSDDPAARGRAAA